MLLIYALTCFLSLLQSTFLRGWFRDRPFGAMQFVSSKCYKFNFLERRSNKCRPWQSCCSCADRKKSVSDNEICNREGITYLPSVPRTHTSTRTDSNDLQMFQSPILHLYIFSLTSEGAFIIALWWNGDLLTVNRSDCETLLTNQTKLGKYDCKFGRLHIFHMESLVSKCCVLYRKFRRVMLGVIFKRSVAQIKTSSVT